MIEEVSMNPDDFQASIASLRSSASSIESSIKTGRTFSKTNIKPFIKDLENVIRAIELIQEYKVLLESDIDTLEQTGEKIRENDERIAQASASVMDEPRPIV